MSSPAPRSATTLLRRVHGILARMKVYRLDAPTPQGSAARDHQAFLQAIDFHEGAMRAGEEVRDPEGAPVASTNAMVVCYAFAAELYLKCLAMIGGGLGPTKGHKLHVLFGRLSGDVQGRLALAYEELTGRPAKALSYDLRLFTDAFHDWRYVYEGEGQQLHTNLLQAFVKAAYVTVRALRPHWSVAAYQHERIVAFVSSSMTLVNLGGGVFVHVTDGTGTLNTRDA